MGNKGYDFYMDKVRLPVTPGKLQISIHNANETVELINEGQINLLKKAGLSDIEFECLIPGLVSVCGIRIGSGGREGIYGGR